MMNMTPLHKPVAGVLSAIFLAGALSGCSESDFDKARKPELIDRAVATSLYRCDLQEKKPQEIPYESRLRLVLAEADSVALDKLEEHGVAVCLDQRIPQTKYGFWDKEIQGIFYNKAKILSMWDNGRNPATQRFYERDILDRAGESIEKLADRVLGTPEADKMQVGATYSCGKSCITWKWKEAAEFSNQLNTNSVLKSAPAAKAETPATPLMTASLH